MLKYRNSLIASLIAFLIDIDLAINKLNGDSIINLVLFGLDKYYEESQIEKYFSTVLLISKLLKELTNHFHDDRQKVFVFAYLYCYIYNI